jgi:acyl dehydratase
MRYAKIYAEDVQPGDEMPPLVKPPIQQIQLTRYAGASGDFNPIHQDDAFARAAGMGGVFAHGMLSMGFVAQSVTDWVGVGRVGKLSVRFAALVRLGDVITCRGKVLEKRPAKSGRDQDVDLELWADNQKGEKVITGRATVTLASRG